MRIITQTFGQNRDDLFQERTHRRLEPFHQNLDDVQRAQCHLERVLFEQIVLDELFEEAFHLWQHMDQLLGLHFFDDSDHWVDGSHFLFARTVHCAPDQSGREQTVTKEWVVVVVVVAVCFIAFPACLDLLRAGWWILYKLIFTTHRGVYNITLTPASTHI